jgi:stearoyl-CoA desaturase (delta-9 desaturase)
MKPAAMTRRYAKDIMRDPLYAFLERKNHWAFFGIGLWLLFYLAGYAAAALGGAGMTESVRFGLSLLVWGGALRTVFVWHTTWAVNSVTHIWGYRNYDTPDDSRNNPIVGLLACGEGWHNNHHADPVAARHGHKWWEIDIAWGAIRLLMLCGLVTLRATPAERARERPAV